MSMRLRRRKRQRKLLIYSLCVLVFLGAVALAMLLARPRDALRRVGHLPGSPEEPTDISTAGDLMVVRVGRQVEAYQLMQVNHQLVAVEVPAKSGR